MIRYPLLALVTALALASSPASAETKQPAKEPTTKSTPAVTKKVNLNTATAEELDALPQIGPARAKAIVEGRAKGKYKNWNDFVARKVIPSNAEAAIKGLVSF
jgi:DNA uptake protein ComE-like DNA-binding protein